MLITVHCQILWLISWKHWRNNESKTNERRNEETMESRNDRTNKERLERFSFNHENCQFPWVRFPDRFLRLLPHMIKNTSFNGPIKTGEVFVTSREHLCSLAFTLPKSQFALSILIVLFALFSRVIISRPNENRPINKQTSERMNERTNGKRNKGANIQSNEQRNKRSNVRV